MGFFSFKTQDTNKSICNTYSGKRTFIVYMFDDKGNIWKEDNYEGYGVFGGKDFFELLAEMNDLGSDRIKGIDLYYSGKPFLSPNLVKYKTKWVYTPDAPQQCEYQGYFYSLDNLI